MYSWTAECLKTSILSNNTSLRAILFGGEPFPKLELISETKHPYNGTKIYNIYGITEVSCWASINEIILTNGQFNVHYLGQLLSHTVFQVKNENGELITSGTGSLYIGNITILTSFLCKIMLQDDYCVSYFFGQVAIKGCV